MQNHTKTHMFQVGELVKMPGYGNLTFKVLGYEKDGRMNVVSEDGANNCCLHPERFEPIVPSETQLLKRLVPSAPLYGYHLEAIVGIRHATGAKGLAHGTTIRLVREPNNAYDRNAIRAEQVSGLKIGYVGKDFAARLAPVMDKTAPWDGVTVACMALDTPDEYDVKVAVAYYGAPETGLQRHLKVRWIGLAQEKAQKNLNAAFQSYQHALNEYKRAYDEDLPFKSAFRTTLEQCKQKYWAMRRGLPRLEGDGLLDASYQEAITASITTSIAAPYQDTTKL